MECDKCGIAVHEGIAQSHHVFIIIKPTGCYGIPEEEDHIRDNGSDLSSFTTVPWFCDTCKAGMNSALCVSSRGVVLVANVMMWCAL